MLLFGPIRPVELDIRPLDGFVVEGDFLGGQWIVACITRYTVGTHQDVVQLVHHVRRSISSAGINQLESHLGDMLYRRNRPGLV